MPDRIIRKTICTSESLSSLSWFEQVLFLRLIVSVDDYGRFDARPQIIKGQLFPFEDVTVSQIQKAFGRLSTNGMISLYEVAEKPYLVLCAWRKYNTPRAKESKYPAPPTVEVDCNKIQTDSSRCKQTKEYVPDIRYSVDDIRYSEFDIRNSENISAGGERAPAREATEGELLSIGIHPGEYCGIPYDVVVETHRVTYDLYQKFLPGRPLAPHDYKKVFRYCGSSGRAALLGYAFEQAALAGKSGDWRYIDGIMEKLFIRGITTEEQARRWDEERPDLETEE